MGLRAKFNLALLAAFAVGYLAAALVIHGVVNANARDLVLQNARIMMAAANAIRDYTSGELDSLLPKERDGKFVAQTIPAFAAQENLHRLHDSFPGFSYREAALNPTNLANRAYDWEADIIRAFREQPGMQEVITERDTPTGPLIHLARPMAVTSEACLTCHSTPAAAPEVMTRTYGAANGFGWRLNEIIGAQIVSMPMALPLSIARQGFLTSMIIVGVAFAAVMVVMNLLLHFVVVAPVKHMSRVAEAASLGDETVESYIKPGRDEISTLSVAFQRMRESLAHALAMLK
jgi:HAMP domain-containing protein